MPELPAATAQGPPDTTYKFYAFISYSHADEAFVKKLQDKIETYQLPSSLQRLKEGLPNKVYPLFRDATDLPPGRLSEEIRKKLADSKYLIVICSPHSAGSYWVNQEIAEFRRLGRPERIIPVIIDGEVNAVGPGGVPDPKRECFPSLLLDEVRRGAEGQLLGVSVPKDGPRKAILKVIAKMLELDPDDLIARDQIRERKRRVVRLAAAAALVLLVGGGSGYYWDYTREKVSYFADYAEQWGLPQGLFPLKEKEAARSDGHYRFISQRRKLMEVAHVAADGRPVPQKNPEFVDRPAIQRFTYADQTGRLLNADYLDQYGGLKVRLVFSGNNYTAIDFKRAGEENETLQAWLAAQTTSAGGGQFGFQDPGAARGQVQRWRVTRDHNGRMVKIEDKQMESVRPAKDQDGVYGQALTLDELGRVVKRLYLDLEGRNFTTQVGVAGKLYQYDGPHLVEVTNIDAQGAPVFDDQKRMITVSGFDPEGRCVERQSLNRDRVLYPDVRGVAKTTWQYDRAGRVVEEAYFGIDGRPWELAEGYAGWRMTRDGPRREKTFFNRDGETAADRHGVALIAETVDDLGRPVNIAHFGPAAEPVSGPDGFFRVTRAYGPHGHVIEEAFFGVDDKPAASRQGVARITRVFNEFGAVKEEAFWGPDGQPALNQDGAARVVTGYDDRGAAETVTHYGLDGQKTLNRQGYAQLKLTTDAQGKPLSLSFFGVDGRPVESLFGYAKSEMTWNERNLLTETRFFDAEGRLTDPIGYGWGGLVTEYDEEGRDTGTAIIDLEGRVSTITSRSEPTPPATTEVLDDRAIVIKPQFADFGVFSGSADLEMTVYNLTDKDVLLSRAQSDVAGLTATFPQGRVVPAKGSVPLKISLTPPGGASGRLDGGTIALAAALPGEPPHIIAALGQFNPGLPPAPGAEGRPMVSHLVSFNP